MDFFQIKEVPTKKGYIEIYPEFKVGRSKDLMVRGKSFYAIWDEEKKFWSKDEYDVQRLVDEELRLYYESRKSALNNVVVNVKYMNDFSSNSWMKFKKYISSISDNAHQLDSKVIFSNTPIDRKDYASRSLSYPLEEGSYEAYNEIIRTLYDPEERAKIEWAIGAIISGDSKVIQKFLVFYGEAGSGKSTILNIIQNLFEGYYATIDAKSITSMSNVFATEVLRDNPLLAIQHDGDLSRIEDNTKLNSIVSHEEININEKFKSAYSIKPQTLLLMATNRPVKITDAKSGVIRRLIDIRPSGRKIPPRKYQQLMKQVEFELGAIAYHCLNVYNEMGKNYYSTYKPVDMMYKTDPFFNFVEDSYFTFKSQDNVSLKQAYTMYKDYISVGGFDYQLPMFKFREELKNYFDIYYDEYRDEEGHHLRSVYEGFKSDKFDRTQKPVIDGKPLPIIFDCDVSIFDKMAEDYPAQYANSKETPKQKWDDVTTTLKDIDTTKLHYVKVPENHIVIDFDIKDENGEKSLEKNLEAASKFKPTYGELSKSGKGIHLHYIYEGDPTELNRLYDEGIEIKVYTGNSSLRRKLVKCNGLGVAKLNSGLPLKPKGELKVVDFDSIKNEKMLRTMIKKNLKKEYHPATKPSVDFIFKLLSDAYDQGLHYDVTDLRPAILAFAASSTNNSLYCTRLVSQMKFKSDEPSLAGLGKENEDIIIFYDVEVFPNLFLVNWKKEGEGHSVVRMINPSPADIEMLAKFKLVGFNCRRYDNHIMYARMMGYTNEQLYNLSKKIISSGKGENKNCFFGEAYNLSYTDIYDYAANKQSLKKWEIELGIHHQELGLPWDEPVPEERWVEVAEYCDNDVIATEAVWNATKADFKARQILVDICNQNNIKACVNDTTNSLTTKIIFGFEKHPELEYTDLSELFPGYVYDQGKNMYKGEDVGFGGYVYAEPGMYGNVALLDVQSMHPSSILAMNCFGEYTKKYEDIYNARVLIKHKDYEAAGKLLNGALKPYLTDEGQAKDLSQALKTAINSVYGLTSAHFDNPFRDVRNVNNIVALRGALFMVNLKYEVQKKGFTVAHIKTDSIKIPDATPEIIEFCMEYAKQYGYIFEHEDTYEKLCLVNNAVYIAKYKEAHIDKDTGKEIWWTATGAQFKVPYVFKTLFSKEPIIFDDMCETKEVKTAMYLDMNEELPEHEHNYIFIGKVGLFCPIKKGKNGGELLRESVDKNGNIKYDSVTGASGFRWLEAEMVKTLDKEKDIDKSYYDKLVNEAIYGKVDGKKRIPGISDFGDFEWFVSEDPYISPPFVGGKIIKNNKGE